MPGDHPRGGPGDDPGASWGRRDQRGGPGASGRRPAPAPPPGRSGMYGPSGAPGASGSNARAPGLAPRYGAPGASGYSQRAPVPYGAPGGRDLDPFAASMADDLRTSARLESIQRKRNGFAIFHDGNAGHLWRGEVVSLLGESLLGVGMIIWLAYLTGSPVYVLLGALALGLPWLLLTTFMPMFENVRDPGRALAWLGRARALAAAGIVGMHFLTIYPVLFGLLFLIGAAGRIRQGLRVAATRVCLEPGEVELVANDLFAGSTLVTVLGPLLAAALFMALGERVILVALAAAGCFLLAANSDGFLDALPVERRAFSHANPASASPDERTRAGLIAAARRMSLDEIDEDEVTASANLTPDQRERALPEWFQQGPTNPFQAIGDIRAGLRLAGGSRPAATSMLALVALALVSGGLSVLEVFYVTERLGLPGYTVGALIAMEAGGVTLGAMVADLPGVRRLQGGYALLGLGLTGLALLALAGSSIPQAGYAPAVELVVFALAGGMGVASGMAVMAARRTARAGRDGVERRAIGAAEAFITALASAVGGVLFTFFYVGYPSLTVSGKTPFPGLPIGLVLAGAGAALALAAAALVVAPGLRQKAPRTAATGKTSSVKDISARMAALPGASGRFARPESGKGKKGKKGAPGASQVGALWDNHPDEGDDADDHDLYTDEHGRAYGDDDDEGVGDGDDLDAEEDDWDEPPRGGPRRGGSPPANPRVNPRGRRNRW